ncbi:MAG: hypothetical protein IJ834_08410 [Paludibacteraceae bacterium]|nr:hypothetical protein [Paludibacteraceae bacterium]
MEILISILAAIGGVSGLVALCSLPWLVKKNKADANIKSASAEDAVLQNYDKYVLRPMQANYTLIMKNYQELLSAALSAKNCTYASTEECPVIRRMNDAKIIESQKDLIPTVPGEEGVL